MLTAVERIAQLSLERAGRVITPARPVADVEPYIETSTPGAERCLPMSWVGMADTWSEERDTRKLLEEMELRLAAGVIARCLGPQWYRHVTKHHTEIKHRDGYGVRNQDQVSRSHTIAGLHRARRQVHGPPPGRVRCVPGKIPPRCVRRYRTPGPLGPHRK